METLDLHGVRHTQAKRLIENFVLLKDLPAKIITGNSPVMRQLVEEVCAKHKLRHEPENFWNLGAYIIRE